MKSTPHNKVLLIVDDREFTANEVRSLVGARRFGDIVFRRRPLIEYVTASLPNWAQGQFFHIRTPDDLAELRCRLECCGEDTAAFIMAARAGFADADRFRQLIERLPYAEEDFTDRLYRPLLIYLRNAHRLVDQWEAIECAPLHHWSRAWQNNERLRSVQPLDLAKIRDFLTFTSGWTSTRHFNAVEVDAYYYTKSSTDKRKMLAEYSFYGLAPEAMRPWLVQPFDYREDGERASYKTMRYYLADTALQWVHGAFDPESFEAFVERLLFFIKERPRRPCGKPQSASLAQELFVSKLQHRVQEFLAMKEGQHIDALVASSNPALGVSQQVQRYLALYRRHEDRFAMDHVVVGHGDPCFSNILYDQQRYLLKLIDPKGAVTEDDLWTHPLYDLCKISHSALGDYDFINNGLYSIGFNERNDLILQIEHSRHDELKPFFVQCLKAMQYDPKIIRLGEASLFLSMLPLHIDYPNKVVAFLLKAKNILDEVERE
ncbi:hypothetical protein [Cupriavidus gilardii]|uniref:hypothetical protein n=1 Tax=Cupriavidus gilardii TaxID=82541 RepID=UPI0007E38D2B|nr:hypothetical protein [Cupriavidus gilardii]